MSYRSSAQRFATQSAAARAKMFGAAFTSTDAEDTPNLQLCSMAGVVTGSSFRAPFTTLQTQREIEQFGLQISCHAVALPLRTLGLTLTLNTFVKSLADSVVYQVSQIIDNPGEAEIKLGLRRLDQ